MVMRNQIVRLRNVFWKWFDRLKLADTRKRIAILAAMNCVIALAVLPFSGAVPDQTVKASVRPAEGAGSWPMEAVPRPMGDTATYLHKKLMKVATSSAGAPVLRFVECRHYPKEHMKVVQTGISSDGHAVLRFMPGDYCLFESGLAASVRVAPTGIDSDSLRTNPPEAPRSENAVEQPNPMKQLLTPYQRYACEKFGPACATALAIQFAENPQGSCEIYHYNSVDGTLDWGFFQINTVHLMKPGVNLRDLLECKANIDFAYRLYTERGFQPWTTYVSGAYRKFLGHLEFRLSASMSAQRTSFPFNLAKPR